MKQGEKSNCRNSKIMIGLEENWSVHKMYGARFNKLFRFFPIFKEPEIELFNINKEAKILDLGCGIGFDLENFRKLGYENTTGIDILPKHVKACNDKGFDAHVGDMQHLCFEDKTFDVVFEKGTLHHTKNYERVFKEVSRVLKDDGMFCIIDIKKTRTRKFLDFMTLKLPIIRSLRYRKKAVELEWELYSSWLKNYDSILKLLQSYFRIIEVPNKNLFLLCLIGIKKSSKIRKIWIKQKSSWFEKHIVCFSEYRVLCVGSKEDFVYDPFNPFCKLPSKTRKQTKSY